VIPWDTITFILGVGFAAGAMEIRNARTRRDVNGLGRKFYRTRKHARLRFLGTVALLEKMAPADHKPAVMELLQLDARYDPDSADEPLNDQDEREHYRDR